MKRNQWNGVVAAQRNQFELRVMGQRPSAQLNSFRLSFQQTSLIIFAPLFVFAVAPKRESEPFVYSSLFLIDLINLISLKKIGWKPLTNSNNIEMNLMKSNKKRNLKSATAERKLKKYFNSKLN